MTLDPPTDSFLPTRLSLLARLKNWDDQQAWREVKVSPRQYLLFSLAALKEIPTHVIKERYEASRAQIYLAKLRVGRLFKAELERLHRHAT